MKNIRIGGRYFDSVFGATGPGPIWQQAMNDALDGTPRTSFQTVNIPVPTPTAPPTDPSQPSGDNAAGGNNNAGGLINGGFTFPPGWTTGGNGNGGKPGHR